MFHSRLADVLAQHHAAPLGHLIQHGELAVTLFFLLSGFVLAYNYRGRLQQRSMDCGFWEARIARVWPAYVLSLVATSLAYRVWPPPLGMSVMTLLMVQGWVPGHPDWGGAWNLVCWTLSCEAFFYLVTPALQRMQERLSAKGLCVAMALFMLLCVVTNGAGQSAFHFYTGIGRYVPLAVARLPEFVIGMLCANTLLLAPERKTWRVPDGTLTWAGLVVSLMLLMLDPLRYGVMLVPFTVLLYGLATESTLLGRVLGSRALVLGGGISYSMYLLQLPVKQLTRPGLALIGIHSDALALGLVPVILILVALPIFLYYEEPARHALRRLFALRTAEHPSA